MRLGTEELELLDRFIEEHPEYSNRSQLARMAIRAFIEARGTQASGTSDGKMLVEIPRVALAVMEGMVRAGIYSSVCGAIEDCVRREFVPKEHLEEVKKKILEMSRETLEVVPD